MGWVFAIGFAAFCLLGLYASKRCSRDALMIAAAAILFALAGFGWQGNPGMPGQPVSRAAPR